MRISKSKKIILFSILAFALTMFVVGLIIIPDRSVQAQIIEIDHVVESQIALNSEIEVPSSINVEFNGTKTAKNGVVVYPDGKVVNAGKIRLNQAGLYELRFYFEDKGITHTAVQKVDVYSEYFSLSNASGGEIIVTDDENKLYCQKDGVKVNLKSGTSFVYNKVLDLRECGEDGLASIIELDGRYGHFDEDGVYVPDVLEGWVRLTDCYNPNLYIELRMQKSVNYTGCLFPGVRTNNQAVTGMDKGVVQVLGSSRIITLDGIKYRVWMGEGSMNVGMYNMKTVMTTGAVWKYDMQTNRVYLSYNGGENFLVTDLDEPLIYTGGNYFPGFTTGEVYVSIYANGYESTYANTEIVSIGKDNLKDVVDKAYVDTFAPVVEVEQTKTTHTGVYGAVGDYFTIPSAKAIDVNIVEGIDVAVYRGYGTNMATNVSVDGGKFKLEHKDVYTIVYTARDKAGNKGYGIFTVSTVDTPDNRAITLNIVQSGSVEAGKPIENLYEITNSINVATSDVDVKISIKSENQNLEGKGEDFTFTPYFAGDYVVSYEYTDGVFSYQKTVNLQCTASSNVCFMDDIQSPKYYLKGDFYAIDDIKGYTFISGKPEPVATDVYAVFDDGEKQKITDVSKLEITGNESVYFIYETKSGKSLITQKSQIIVSEYYNAGGRKLGYDMTKFFVGDYTASAVGSDGKRIKNITYTSNKLSGDNTLSYFNPISGRNFVLEYKVVLDEANFEKLRINLTDCSNDKNKLFLDIVNGEDSTYVSVNGGSLVKLEHISFVDSFITVSYDYDSKFLRVQDFSASVNFDAKTVYLDVETLGMSGKSSVIITRVNNHTLAGNNYADSSEPELYIRDFQGDYEQGDIVTVSVPEYSDVVSGVDYSSANIRITCSDGQTVYDENGNPLTNLNPSEVYKIKLDRIAKFYVIYEIKDFSENIAQRTIIVNCADTIAPTIVLNNIKDGETIKVKPYQEIKINFTVSDNVTAAKDIITYIHLYCVDMFSYVPNVSNIKSENVPVDGVYKEKFAITIKGRYQAQINVQDAEGNRYVKCVDIIVE